MLSVWSQPASQPARRQSSLSLEAETKEKASHLCSSVPMEKDIEEAFVPLSLKGEEIYLLSLQKDKPTRQRRQREREREISTIHQPSRQPSEGEESLFI